MKEDLNDCSWPVVGHDLNGSFRLVGSDNDQVHRPRATASREAEQPPFARSGATASWAAWKRENTLTAHEVGGFLRRNNTIQIATKPTPNAFP